MIIVDFSQLFMCCLFGSKPTEGINEDAIVHSFFSRLLEYKQLFSDSGKIVMAFDGRKTWRKSVFPEYKANRADSRAKQNIDWDSAFGVLNKLKKDIQKEFSFCSIEVDEAEADDIVAVLTESFCNKEKIVIISSDRDFLQLQKYEGVSQYSPTTNSMVYSDNPERDIKLKLLKGDTNDGIPNVFSDNDALIRKIRQKPIYESKLDEYYKILEEASNHAMLKNYQRNKTLIDFTCIPKEIKIKILEFYIKQIKSKEKSKVSASKYFESKNMFMLVPLSESLEN